MNELTPADPSFLTFPTLLPEGIQAQVLRCTDDVEGLEATLTVTGDSVYPSRTLRWKSRTGVERSLMELTKDLPEGASRTVFVRAESGNFSVDADREFEDAVGSFYGRGNVVRTLGDGFRWIVSVPAARVAREGRWSPVGDDWVGELEVDGRTYRMETDAHGRPTKLQMIERHGSGRHVTTTMVPSRWDEVEGIPYPARVDWTWVNFNEEKPVSTLTERVEAEHVRRLDENLDRYPPLRCRLTEHGTWARRHYGENGHFTIEEDTGGFHIG